MTKQDDFLFFRVPKELRDLIRFRATVQRMNMSEYVRKLILENLPPPTEQETFFLTQNAPEIEQTKPNGAHP